jgi:hypothetical protein
MSESVTASPDHSGLGVGQGTDHLADGGVGVEEVARHER